MLIGDRKRVTILLIRHFKLALEIRAPKLVDLKWPFQCRPCRFENASSSSLFDEIMLLQNRVNSAHGRKFNHRMFTLEIGFNFRRAPGWVNLAEVNNELLNDHCRLIRDTSWGARLVLKASNAFDFKPLKDLVTGLSRDPVFTAEVAHFFVVEQSGHERHS